MYEMGAAEIEAASKVIQSGQLFRYRGGEGGQCDQFEKELCAKVGVTRAIVMCSGTTALTCALIGAEIGPGDEVIVPAYTFIATAIAVLAAGGVPVVAEVDETLMLDPEDVKAKITPQTKAIIPVHMVGRICNMAALTAIAKQHKLAIIEDACQAMGGSYRGKRVGSIGAAGAYSYNQFKIMCAGEGGAVVTSDQKIYDRSLIQYDTGCAFRAHAAQVKSPFFAGNNYRVSEITGAILRVQLGRLDGMLTKLRERRAVLSAELGKSSAWAISPSNEEAGDCGVCLPLIFENETLAAAFVESHRGAGVDLYRPIDTGRHVYSNWTPMIEQRGSHAELLNPYRMAKRKIDSSAEACPRSLEIFKRSVVIHVPYGMMIDEVGRLGSRMAQWVPQTATA